MQPERRSGLSPFTGPWPGGSVDCHPGGCGCNPIAGDVILPSAGPGPARFRRLALGRVRLQPDRRGRLSAAGSLPDRRYWQLPGRVRLQPDRQERILERILWRPSSVSARMARAPRAVCKAQKRDPEERACSAGPGPCPGRGLGRRRWRARRAVICGVGACHGCRCDQPGPGRAPGGCPVPLAPSQQWASAQAGAGTDSDIRPPCAHRQALAV